MKATVRGLLMGCWLALCWLPAARGADHMPWCNDFRLACGLAAEQQRLVLLHFTRDNCPPCRKVEAEVFSEPKVAQAVSQNFIPVLVHQAKNPDLVTRYHVKLFPTDVMVTPSGLEVYRAISPQKPADFIMLVNQVAQQTGTSSPRQWADRLAQAAQQSAGGTADKAHQAAAAASGFAGQFTPLRTRTWRPPSKRPTRRLPQVTCFNNKSSVRRTSCTSRRPMPRPTRGSRSGPRRRSFGSRGSSTSMPPAAQANRPATRRRAWRRPGSRA